MIRFLGLWAVLFLTLATMSAATSLFLFRHVDLRYEVFVAFMVVPPVQALALVVLARHVDWSAWFDSARLSWQHPLVAPMLLLDTLLLASGWIVRRHPLLGLSGGTSLQPAWIGTKAIAAALFLLALVLTRQSIPGRILTSTERLILVVFLVALAAVGVAGFWPWLEWLPDAVFRGQTRPALILRWVETYGGVLLITVTLMLVATAVLRRRSAHLGMLGDMALGLVLAGALTLVVDVFVTPIVGEPERSIALTCASLASTLLLASAIQAAVPVATEQAS